MFESLCRPGGCEKDDQESTISRDLGILFGSLCRPGRCETEVQESTISRDLRIVFESLCRPGREFYVSYFWLIFVLVTGLAAACQMVFLMDFA